MGQSEISIPNSQNPQIQKTSEKKLTRNDFKFLYIIGRGGFSKVWKVQLKKTKEYFALKEMSKVKIIDKHSEESIKNEKEILSKLKNDFIINIYFAFQDFSNLYLVMDYLKGGDLRYHISKKNYFTETETKFFISNIILGLKYIHSKNIIHRDLKPENLILDSKGYIRITDFGISKINEKDNSKETSGTPGYMSPEVLFIQNHSFISDFFALGIIGFELCFGYRPYIGRNRKEIKDVILYKQAKINFCDLPCNYSKDFASFINGLIMRKPNLRLGFKNGFFDLFNHPWLKNVNWNLIKEKKIKAPFIPDLNVENYDKEYCEMNEKIGNDTLGRYYEYMNDDSYNDVFKDYFYFNYDNDISKNYKSNSRNFNIGNKGKNCISNNCVYHNKIMSFDLQKSEIDNNNFDNKTVFSNNLKQLNKSNSVLNMPFKNYYQNNEKSVSKGKRKYSYKSVIYNDNKFKNTYEHDGSYYNNNNKSQNKSNNIKKKLNISNINNKSNLFSNIIKEKFEKRKRKNPIIKIRTHNNKSEIHEMMENESLHFIDNIDETSNIEENMSQNISQDIQNISEDISQNIKKNIYLNIKKSIPLNSNRNHYKKISLDIPQTNTKIYQKQFNSNIPVFKSKIMSWVNKSSISNSNNNKDKISLSTTNILSSENKENINNYNTYKKKIITTNNSHFIKPLIQINKKCNISINSSRISKNSTKNTDNSLNKLQRNNSTHFSPLQNNTKNNNKNKKILIPKSNKTIKNNFDDNKIKINTLHVSKKSFSKGKTSTK